MQPEVSSCSQGQDCLQGAKCWQPNQRTPPGSPSTSCWDAHAPGPKVIVPLQGPRSLSTYSTHIYLVPTVCQGPLLEPGSEALPSGRLVWGVHGVPWEPQEGMHPTIAYRVGRGQARLDRLQGLGTEQEKWPGS